MTKSAPKMHHNGETEKGGQTVSDQARALQAARLFWLPATRKTLAVPQHEVPWGNCSTNRPNNGYAEACSQLEGGLDEKAHGFFI